ncbi:MAG: long-chain fatty acid--CoA ligase [Deltaproteobacteria bacterium]|nr:long-chain fatty acid--CoA ligase [Deltaproteobacteria bacterium]
MPATIPARLFDLARRRPRAPAYHVRRDGVWHASSFADYAAEVSRAGRALMALGFEAGQRTCILGFNRPEWTIFDLATMSAGGAPAGIYTTSSPDEVAYVLEHSEAPFVLVEDEGQWEKVKQKLDVLPALRHVVLMKDAARVEHEMVLSWEDFLAKGDDIAESALEERLEALEPDGLATLIYTSGTTGPPKGVMLSHDNLAWTAEIAEKIVGAGPSDHMLSYLPLSHIAEQMFTIHVPLTCGGSVYFARSIADLPEDLKEAAPTVFFGVPRIWEKLHAGIFAKAAGATGLKKRLLAFARAQGTKAADARQRGETPGGLGLRIADRLVHQKVRDAVGLGHAHVCVSGAAPISREVLVDLASVGIVVLEVYGQSEGTGPTTFNRPDHFRFGSVGPKLPGVEVRIADDGEIVFKGRNVFLGYFRDPEATAECLKDGWLHSGDLGELRDGLLFITGRKKDILITAGGKNITPKNIESALKNHPLIGEAVVIGDRRKYLTALVALDPDAAGSWAKDKGVDAATLNDNSALARELDAHREKVNGSLARVEQVKKLGILPRPLSIEGGELTPTLKVKRAKVYEHFASEIEALYADA